MPLAADTTFLDYASKGGVVVILVVILYGGFKDNPWWVFGWVYRDLLARYIHRGHQLDKWWDVARRATTTAEVLAGNKLPEVGESDDDGQAS